MGEKEIMELRYKLILSTSNIAKREMMAGYECRDKAILQILAKPIEWVKSGRSLYLYGPVGTGKTLTAVTILKRYAQELAKQTVFSVLPIMYVSMLDLFAEVKRDIGRSIDELVSPPLIANLKEADVVVIDEVGSLKYLSEFEKGVLFEVVDDRVREMKPTIYASNSDEIMLKQALGDQLFSRVYTASERILMNGQDNRGK